MKIRTDYFPFGSSYYPPYHTPEEWERDLPMMAAAGLRQIRTAEMLTSWDYIEPKRGQPEWEWLDRLFELADENNIDVVLGTGSANPPIWMIEAYPDLQRVSREGVLYPTNTVWGWACVNNPGLRNELTRWIALLYERYGQHPRLFVWQIDNQIGLHAAFTQKVSTISHATGEAGLVSREYGYFCYCDHCARLFRAWVQNKYLDIEVLNHGWSWDPTHYRYYDWHQVEPPRSMPAEWGNGTAWLDFRRFMHESLNDYVQTQHDLIKAHDATQMTMTNLYNCVRPDLGARSEPNHWDMGGIPDVIGHDHYPSEHNFKKDPSYASWFFDFAYSVARHNDRTMWVPEIESGPVGRFSAGPKYATRARDIKRFVLEAIGHGAKQILYMGYRDWNCIPLTWGALVDFHGDPTERYDVAADIARVVREHDDFFLDALPAPAQVALYHTHDNVILLDGQVNERFLYGALRGAHEALWRRGYDIEFIEPRFLNGVTCDYKAILLPFVMYMPRDHAEQLEQYVADGGILIAFAKLGHLDEKGWAWSDRPGAGLTELFGARETFIEAFDEPDYDITIKVERDISLFAGVETDTIMGYWHRQEFSLVDDVDVLARFVDDTPAIIRRRHGKGQAILIATHLDLAFHEHREPAVEQVFANLMSMCGVEQSMRVTGENQDYIDSWVDGHLLRHTARHAVLINNNGKVAVDVTVRIPAGNVTTANDLFAQQALDVTQSDGAQFALHLPAWEGTIVMLE